MNEEMPKKSSLSKSKNIKSKKSLKKTKTKSRRKLKCVTNNVNKINFDPFDDKINPSKGSESDLNENLDIQISDSDVNSYGDHDCSVRISDMYESAGLDSLCQRVTKSLKVNSSEGQDTFEKIQMKPIIESNNFDFSKHSNYIICDISMLKAAFAYYKSTKGCDDNEVTDNVDNHMWESNYAAGNDSLDRLSNGEVSPQKSTEHTRSALLQDSIASITNLKENVMLEKCSNDFPISNNFDSNKDIYDFDALDFEPSDSELDESNDQNINSSHATFPKELLNSVVVESALSLAEQKSKLELLELENSSCPKSVSEHNPDEEISISLQHMDEDKHNHSEEMSFSVQHFGEPGKQKLNEEVPISLQHIDEPGHIDEFNCIAPSENSCSFSDSARSIGSIEKNLERTPIPSEDDSDSESEHCFKRRLQNDEDHNPAPISCVVNGFPSDFRQPKDVIIGIQNECKFGRLTEALNIAKKYILLTSDPIQRDKIFKKLFICILKITEGIDPSYETYHKAISDSLDIFYELRMHSSKLCSWIISNCVCYDAAHSSAESLLKFCEKEKIVLESDAINAYTDYLQRTEALLDNVFFFMQYLKEICGTTIPAHLLNDTTYRFVDEEESTLSVKFLQLCKYLIEMKQGEVTINYLQHFIDYCIEKDCWSEIADFIRAWSRKDCEDCKNHSYSNLLNCILQALASNLENVGLYFEKITFELFGNQDDKSEFAAVFGKIGALLLVELFDKGYTVDAYKILKLLSTHDIPFVEISEWEVLATTLPTFSKMECQSNKANESTDIISPFKLVSVAVETCLKLERLEDAYTMLLSLPLTIYEGLDDAVKSDMHFEYFQYLLKLTKLLQSSELGIEVFRNLFVVCETNISEEDLFIAADELRDLYHKYLVSFLNGNDSAPLAAEFYEHCNGRCKDIFTLEPQVLRGLFVLFYQNDLANQANKVFLKGFTDKIYSTVMLDSTPFHINVLTHWTEEEIAYILRQFFDAVKKMGLFRKNQKIEFEKWVDVKIYFKKTGEVCSDIDILKTAPDTIEELQKTTCKILKSFDENMAWTSTKDCLTLQSEAFYSFCMSTPNSEDQSEIDCGAQTSAYHSAEENSSKLFSEESVVENTSFGSPGPPNQADHSPCQTSVTKSTPQSSPVKRTKSPGSDSIKIQSDKSILQTPSPTNRSITPIRNNFSPICQKTTSPIQKSPEMNKKFSPRNNEVASGAINPQIADINKVTPSNRKFKVPIRKRKKVKVLSKAAAAKRKKGASSSSAAVDSSSLIGQTASEVCSPSKNSCNPVIASANINKPQREMFTITFSNRGRTVAEKQNVTVNTKASKLFSTDSNHVPAISSSPKKLITASEADFTLRKNTSNQISTDSNHVSGIASSPKKIRTLNKTSFTVFKKTSNQISIDSNQVEEIVSPSKRRLISSESNCTVNTKASNMISVDSNQFPGIGNCHKKILFSSEPNFTVGSKPSNELSVDNNQVLGTASSTKKCITSSGSNVLKLSGLSLPEKRIILKPKSTLAVTRSKPVPFIDVPEDALNRISLFLKSKILLKHQDLSPTELEVETRRLTQDFCQKNAILIQQKKYLKVLNDFASTF